MKILNLNLFVFLGFYLFIFFLKIYFIMFLYSLNFIFLIIQSTNSAESWIKIYEKKIRRSTYTELRMDLCQMVYNSTFDNIYFTLRTWGQIDNVGDKLSNMANDSARSFQCLLILFNCELLHEWKKWDKLSFLSSVFETVSPAFDCTAMMEERFGIPYFKRLN